MRMQRRLHVTLAAALLTLPVVGVALEFFDAWLPLAVIGYVGAIVAVSVLWLES